MTQDQFQMAIDQFTQTSVVWDGETARVEGGIVGLRYLGGKAQVWNQHHIWVTRRASKLEDLVVLALKGSIDR